MLKIKFQNFLQLIKSTYKSWNNHDPFRQSAVIAYYAVFSMPGLLVVIITMAGFIFGADAVTGSISAQISETMGKDTANQVQEMIAKSSESKKSIIATIIGALILIFGATGVFAELQKSLNIIWSVKAANTGGIMQTVKARVFSFGLVVSIGFLLIISLVISAALTAVSDWLKLILSDFTVYILYVLNFSVSLGLFTLMFGIMFKILPDVKLKWRNVWQGAALTAILLMIGKFALSLYFGKAEPASAYGAAGSIVLILLWVSYSCMILFFGAEFTMQQTKSRNEKIIPVRGAKLLPEECEI